MRVLLLSANREDFPDPVYPLGVALVAAAAEARGHEVRVLDLRWDREGIAAGVRAFDPEVAGVGIRNVDNLTWGRSVSYLEELREALAAVREVFSGPVVLGGSGYSLFPRELLEALEAPYGVVGEGEDAFPALLGCLERGEAPGDLPGLVARGKTAVPPPPRRDPVGWSPRPSPAVEGLLRRYAAAGAAVGVQTKRGCPFRCSYCTYPALEGGDLRLRDPREVVEEISHLARSGVGGIFFVDDAFNVPADHAEAVCRLMVERGLRLPWAAFAHPGSLSPSLAAWMAESGCVGLEFGTDSLADPVLEALRKGFTAAGVRAAVAAAHAAGLPTAHYLLLGSPGETPATLTATLEGFDELPPAAVLAMVGVRIYPGTPLAAQAEREGVLEPGADLLAPHFYLSPGISPPELLDPLGEHARKRPAWVVPTLGIRSDSEMIRRHRRAGEPSWRLLLDRLQVRRGSRDRSAPPN